MKHAFLIIAHNNWQQLKNLISAVDSSNIDFYIHVNSKVEMPNIDEIKQCTYKSKVYFTERVPITWGDFGICNASLVLLKTAYDKNRYDYFHLLTGADLLLVGVQKFSDFFQNNRTNNNSDGLDTNYLTIQKPSKRMASRVVNYNLFIPLWGSSNWLVRKVGTLSSHLFCNIQGLFKFNRFKKDNIEIYKGSPWWSISYSFATYFLKKSDWVIDKFKCGTFAADEYAIHTVFMNSEYKPSLFNQSHSNLESNLRLIDFENGNGYGSPCIWRIKDIDRLKSTENLIARKFDMNIDTEIVEEIMNNIREDCK